jgi:DNA-binding transcriptional regulator LsrR (DeoR family)
MPTSHDDRHKPARRMLLMLRLMFMNTPMTLANIAEELRVNSATVLRLIWAAQKEGIPIKCWRSEQWEYRYYLDKYSLWKWFGGEARDFPVMRKHERPPRNPMK